MKQLVQKLKKMLKIDVEYFGIQGFWSGIGNSSTFIKNIFLGIILINILSIEEYGKYTLLGAIFSFAGVTSLPGLWNSIILSASSGKDGTFLIAQKKIRNYSFIGSIIIMLVGAYNVIINNLLIDELITIGLIAILFPFISSLNIYPYLLQGKKNFKLLAKISWIFNSIILLIVGGLSTFFHRGSQIYIGLLITTIIMLIIVDAYIKKVSINNKIASGKDIRFGKRISLYEALRNIIGSVEKIIVATILGPYNLAVYSVIMLVPNQLSTPFNIIKNTLLPKVHEKKINTAWVKSGTRKINMFIIVAITIYVFSSKIIFETFFSGYENYFLWSAIYSISFLTYGANPSLVFEISSRNSKKINHANIIHSTSTIIITIALSSLYGLPGAIIAKMFSRLIIYILYAKY